MAAALLVGLLCNNEDEDERNNKRDDWKATETA
jgi:hypothetical protein